MLPGSACQASERVYKGQIPLLLRLIFRCKGCGIPLLGEWGIPMQVIDTVHIQAVLLASKRTFPLLSAEMSVGR
jgi:hypothetical protein